MITTQTEESSVSLDDNTVKSHWILFAVCILGIMIQIDFTAVNVALIAIGRTLQADLSVVQWALSAYVLAWGAFALTAGRCSDLFGKRRTFLLGTFLFMLGSALTGAATHAWFLILGRVVQGIGGALFLPGVYTLVFTSFPEHRRGYALGILTSAIAIGMAAGPTFGGIILHVLNWRWIFFLNLPLGIPVIAIILWAVPREPRRLSAEPMDYPGAVLIAASLGLLMFTFNQVTHWGYSLPFWGCLIISLVLMLIFILHERRIQFPLIQLEMFRNSVFLGCSLTFIAVGFTFSMILMTINLYLQNALDYSATNTGFIFLIMTAMFAVLSVYGGKLVDRMDPRVPIGFGLAVTILSALTFVLCTQHSPLWVPMLGLALYGIGGGLAFPALNAILMKSVPQNLLGTASSAFAMFGVIANTAGLILSSVIVITCGQNHLHDLLNLQGWSFSDDQIQQLNTIISSTHYNAGQLTHFSIEQILPMMDNLRASFVHAMHVNMSFVILLTLISLIISLLMIKSKRPITTHTS